MISVSALLNRGLTRLKSQSKCKSILSKPSHPSLKAMILSTVDLMRAFHPEVKLFVLYHCIPRLYGYPLWDCSARMAGQHHR